jgi:alanine-glyoxylate transaminase/serine-glyoxylate transaminase/serine-pyruvate transaminase
VARAGALLLVDTVTSLVGMEVDVGGSRIDVCYGGMQKCLSCPPRLAPVPIQRTGLMGERATPRHVEALLGTLNSLLKGSASRR